MNERLLHIYLNDHHAGAIAGIELTKRSLSNNQGNEFGDGLAGVLPDIQEDYEVLRELMRRLGVRVDPVKHAAAWASEKVGRLKLNGSLRGYSPLSRVVELEGLALGIKGKSSLWQGLKQIADVDSRLAVTDFDRLIKRAESQRDQVEQLHLKASEIAFR